MREIPEEMKKQIEAYGYGDINMQFRRIRLDDKEGIMTQPNQEKIKILPKEQRINLFINNFVRENKEDFLNALGETLSEDMSEEARRAQIEGGDELFECFQKYGVEQATTVPMLVSEGGSSNKKFVTYILTLIPNKMIKDEEGNDVNIYVLEAIGQPSNATYIFTCKEEELAWKIDYLKNTRKRKNTCK